MQTAVVVGGLMLGIVLAHADKASSAHSPQDVAPPGIDWQCAEGDDDSMCFRFSIECRLRRGASIDRSLSKCDSQKNAAVVTFFDAIHERWNWLAFASVRRCKDFRDWAVKERADDFPRMSQCTLVGKKGGTKVAATPTVIEGDIRAFLRQQLGAAPTLAYCFAIETSGKAVSSCSFSADECAEMETKASREDRTPIVKKCASYKSVDVTPSADSLNFARTPEECENVAAWLKSGPCVHVDL